MENAYTSVGTRTTPQSEAIIGQDQVRNDAGGFVYELDDWKAFERFLILGSEGGTYYISEQTLTKKNAVRTFNAITKDGARAVEQIVKVSDAGRAPKNDPAIFALAIAASVADPKTRQLALAALPKVCRIPTHLFHFLTYVRQFRGFGRGLKRAVGNWYNEMPVEKLAYEVVKYQSRDGWSNADLLRLSHPKTSDKDRNAIYKYIVDGCTGAYHPGEFISAFEAAKASDDVKHLTRLIKQYNLSREMLPTEALTKPEVWEALLEKMPYTAMIRNLGNISKCGLLKPLSNASRLIVERLHDESTLKKARIHPIALLIAQKTYASGKGLKGKGEWTVVPAVVDALNDAFYLAFNHLEPTGKWLLIGVDVSGSMGSPCGTLPLTCAEGAAAMALACAKTEREYYIMGFTGSAASGGRWGGYYNAGGNGDLAGFVDLGITPNMGLDDALAKTRGLNFGVTDCALPALWALKNQAKVDCFVIITDNETWVGKIHPSQALRQYREQINPFARQVVVGMTSTNFSIASPDDALSIDISGFDASVPQMLQEFVR